MQGNQNINYKKQTDIIILENQAKGVLPKLLLHSCCAPCSSSVLEYLHNGFLIDVLYYNPNIAEKDEYLLRMNEQKAFLEKLNFKNKINFLEGDYDSENFLIACKGMENEPEGGKRCELCFNMRLKYTSELANRNNYDFFATTLTVSPLKNAEKINKIGTGYEKFGISRYLCSDFKKGNGYKRSIELSRDYGLYRQNYCGCPYSKRIEKQIVN